MWDKKGIQREREGEREREREKGKLGDRNRQGRLTENIYVSLRVPWKPISASRQREKRERELFVSLRFTPRRLHRLKHTLRTIRQGYAMPQKRLEMKSFRSRPCLDCFRFRDLPPIFGSLTTAGQGKPLTLRLRRFVNRVLSN